MPVKEFCGCELEYRGQLGLQLIHYYAVDDTILNQVSSGGRVEALVLGLVAQSDLPSSEETKQFRTRSNTTLKLRIVFVGWAHIGNQGAMYKYSNQRTHCSALCCGQ